MNSLEFYRAMATIRHFEEEALALSRAGHVAGSIHLCLGQEAIPVGALSAVEPGDRVLSTYRGHGWALACGTDPRALLAEIAQREPGINGGRAGSPLLSDPDHGFLGENSIVGAGVPVAAGVALARRMQKTGRVVLVSIGDGAINQGSVSEGMAFAAMHDLPLIIVCENNGWSEMTPISSTTRTEIHKRAAAIGMRAESVDGQDPRAVADAVHRAAAECRQGKGPVFLECQTVRLGGHYNKDIEHYRPQADRDAAAEADPLLRIRNDAGADLEALDQIDIEVKQRIASISADVVQMPAPTPHDVLEHVYGPPVTTRTTPESAQTITTELTYWKAVNEALGELLETMPEVLVYGEDVAEAGGIFGVTRGLQKRFGGDRVFDTPIAESAILGSAVGAAIEGMRPVVEIMWADFLFVALDQIVNQAANVRYVNRSRLSAPLTVRMQQGITPGSCAQHSQSIEAILAHIPGIKVGLPTTPQDAYTMTRAAVLDPDPVVLIENRAMYTMTGPVERGSQDETAAGAEIRRPGSDLTIFTWGTTVATALTAAADLSKDGIEAEVVDLRWLRPLDEAAIANSVRRTGGRVLVLHEATRTGGFGAEVAALISEKHHDLLVRPVIRVAAPDVRVPSAPSLQAAVLPSPEKVANAARDLLR
ncbi:thiamine pyrophosphate-dependent enzyme [Streptomyces sp. NPDC058045]|uniref:alpha-ketoacid dehydrogenase subunit alpha/beta n=1 Tax=Streptomyces sp. NPDC058045 TaxID=3346311 RepID=UPI0036EDF79B